MQFSSVGEFQQHLVMLDLVADGDTDRADRAGCGSRG